MVKEEKAVFGAGCFWHVESAFSKVTGVIKTKVGYMGGDENKHPNPTYEEVCSDKTGYAEVVEIAYDAEKINYKKLVEIFWELHDPTQLNRQGADVGTQYRSVIFYYNEKQKEIAENSKGMEEKRLGKKIVTEIAKAGKFFPAEEYHQRYLEKAGKTSCEI